MIFNKTLVTCPQVKRSICAIFQRKKKKHKEKKVIEIFL